MLPIASKSHPEALQSALKMAARHRKPLAELEAAISQQNVIPANRGRKGMRDARPSRRASARKGPQALAKASQEPYGVSTVTDFGEQAGGDRSKRNRDEARPGAQPPSIPGAATRPARTGTAASLFPRNKRRLGTHASRRPVDAPPARGGVGHPRPARPPARQGTPPRRAPRAAGRPRHGQGREAREGPHPRKKPRPPRATCARGPPRENAPCWAAASCSPTD